MNSMQFVAMILFHYFLIPTLAIPTIITRLIHYQSVCSPIVLQSNYSDLEILVARIMQLGGGMTLSKASESYFDTNIFIKPPPLLFLVEFSIGQLTNRGTGFSQIVSIDTGSSLLSVRCDGYDGFSDDGSDDGRNDDGDDDYNRYDPRLSSTYSLADCELCEEPLECQVTPNGCHYSQRYITTAATKGYLRSEEFTFESSLHKKSGGISISKERGISIPNITFGCLLGMSGFNRKLNGVLGLGTAKFSLLSQMRMSEFSYCIGNVKDPSSTGNVLIIGPNEDYKDYIQVENSTPFSNDSTHYQVNLTGISFRGMMLEIDKEQVSVGNTIFDLGSSISVLQPIAYKNLHDEISDWIKQETPLEPIYSRVVELCYWGIEDEIEEALKDFPLLSFHFDGDATLDLDGYNIFRREGHNVVCLNVMNAHDKLWETFPYNLIGVYLQQDHYMRYDLVNRRIFMEMMDCESWVT